jgi:hypothetical protein
MDAGSPFLGVKRPGVKLTTHIHLVLRLKHVELYLHPSYVFMPWCLIKQEIVFMAWYLLKQRGKFIFTIT